MPALALALLLGACATTGSPGSAPGGVFGSPAPGATPAPGAPGAPDGAPPRPTATPLVTEQRFLEDWFRGTPVAIAAEPPTMLQVEVPLVHSFDAGKADVKPALGAVLDRVSQSLLRHAASRVTVTAPADTGGAPALSQTRGERVRDHLIRKGIAATRVTLIDGGRAGAPVQLRMALPATAAAPLARRNEPASSRSPVQPISTQRPTVPTWTEKKP